jgi:catechol 2,3-dioxygenase-like lactoylglutathione lyase family enzyme
MRATGFNHVSINALELEESVRFYEDVFGLERIPTYGFSFPTQYLQLGDLQLHIFERPTEAPPFHHIGINVDDFEAAYRRLQELQVFDRSAFYHHIYELPDGSVQMYLRDPAGNLVEVDWPDIESLDRSVVEEIRALADIAPQEGDARDASLYYGWHDDARAGALRPGGDPPR